LVAAAFVVRGGYRVDEVDGARMSENAPFSDTTSG
jgi:hypothetical protein